MARYKQLSQKRILDDLLKQGIFKDTSLSFTDISVQSETLITRVEDELGHSVIITQILNNTPNSASTTEDNVQHIALNALQERQQSCPDYTADLLYLDQEHAFYVMQDLKHFTPLSTRLIRGDNIKTLSGLLAQYLAQSLFYTSDLYVLSDIKRAKQTIFSHPAGSQLTQQSHFEHPYNPDDNPNKHDFIRPLMEDEQHDPTLLAEIAELNLKFINTSQALLHGKLTPDAILLDNEELKVTTSTLSSYGPIGFDVGTLLGQLLINFCTSALRFDKYTRADHLDALIDLIRATWNQFADYFSELMQKETQNPCLMNETFQARYLRSIFLDSVGFAGCELIAQSYWAATNEPTANTRPHDIHCLKNDAEQSTAIADCMALGKVLINKRYQFVSINDVLLEAEAIIEH